MKPIFEQLDPNMLSRVKNLSLLTHILQQALPVQAHSHFHVVNINQQTLFVLTDSPIWATKLRQLASDLIKSLQTERLNNAYKTQNSTFIPASLKHIKVLTRPAKIQPATADKSNKPIKYQRYISEQAALSLTRTADFIDDDNLSKALHRLATHTR